MSSSAIESWGRPPSRAWLWRGLAAIGAAVVVLPLALGVLLWIFGGLGIIGFLVLAGYYGWMLSAYFYYRYARQEEFLNLLTTAAEAGAPLAPTLWAYLLDRPQGSLRELWVAGLLFFVLPGYYWFWHRGHRFDAKVAQVAEQLEEGLPLHQALQAVPGVAPRETELAAAVGESSGQLALSLRRIHGARSGVVWVEIAPRLIYPLMLLLFLGGMLEFWRIFILPRFERIFADFRLSLPAATERLIAVGDALADSGWQLVLSLQGVILLGVLFLLSPTARWYFPGLGRLHRLGVRSRVLTMLGLLLDIGKPVPEALAVLAESGYFAGTARRRLEAARREVEQGESLAMSLYHAGLVLFAMIQLIQAAERLRNLPWALTELGNQVGQRMIRLTQRISLVLAPLAVVGVGLLAAFMVLALFLPLIKLIEGLTR
jgi:type IV pilus assembly protein PilC